MNLVFRLASLNMAAAVALGAFGAHTLRGHLSGASMATWQTGSHYHLILGLAAWGLAVVPRTVLPPKRTARAASLILAGCVVFSGSLYLLATTGVRWLGAITPIGGVLFIGTWVWLALGGRTEEHEV